MRYLTLMGLIAPSASITLNIFLSCTLFARFQSFPCSFAYCRVVAKSILVNRFPTLSSLFKTKLVLSRIFLDHLIIMNTISILNQSFCFSKYGTSPPLHGQVAAATSTVYPWFLFRYYGIASSKK
jgi:hypothetical protein